MVIDDIEKLNSHTSKNFAQMFYNTLWKFTPFCSLGGKNSNPTYVSKDSWRSCQLVLPSIMANTPTPLESCWSPMVPVSVWLPQSKGARCEISAKFRWHTVGILVTICWLGPYVPATYYRNWLLVPSWVRCFTGQNLILFHHLAKHFNWHIFWLIGTFMSSRKKS